jgi:uncharacterized repeat protein (TIGR04052 family)
MRRSLAQASVVSCFLWCLAGCGDDAEAGSPDAGPAAGSGGGGKGSAAAGGRSGSSATAGRAGTAGRSGAGGGAPETDAGDGRQAVTIRFKAKLGDQDLQCGKEYADQGSAKHRATPQDFRFFVEEIRLISADGKQHPVRFAERAPFQQEGVALLDFTDGSGACGSGGAVLNTEVTGSVEAGEYRGVVIVNGVPERLNHQNISVAKPPLQDGSTYWTWQSGYRFILAELLPTDVEPAPEEDAGAPDPHNPHGAASVASFVHVGATGCVGNNTDGYECSFPNRTEIRLDDFDPEADFIVADLGKVFEDVDLSHAVGCHGAGPDCAPTYAAFGLSLESGKPDREQKVFRVER